MAEARENNLIVLSIFLAILIEGTKEKKPYPESVKNDTLKNNQLSCSLPQHNLHNRSV